MYNVCTRCLSAPQLFTMAEATSGHTTPPTPTSDLIRSNCIIQVAVRKLSFMCIHSVVAFDQFKLKSRKQGVVGVGWVLCVVPGNSRRPRLGAIAAGKRPGRTAGGRWPCH